MEKWVGKVAVVTGASVGIGASIAKTLSENGMIVVGLARRDENISSLAKVTKGKLYGIKCDLQEQDSIENAFRTIEDKFGGVDVLINNAALMNFASIMDGPPSEWKKVFDTNIMGVSICTREALKTMRSRGDNGHIIFINSILGKIAYNGFKDSVGMYPTSKWAINGLAHSLRMELKNAKSLIGITSLYPGLVNTDMGNDAANNYEGLTIEKNLDNTVPGFLAAQDLADVVVNVLNLNSRIEIQELSVQCRGMSV